MKKILSVILVSALAVSLAGCSKTDDYGNKVETSGSHYTVYPEELPYSIDFNGAPVTFSGIDFYEYERSYDYELIVILRFDLSGLTEQQYDWFLSDHDASVNITSEDNDLDDAHMNYLGYGTSSGEWIEGYSTWSKISSNNYHYSFAGSELSVDFSLDESEGDITKRTIDYTMTVPDDMPDRYDMDEETMKWYAYWLGVDTSYLEREKSIYSPSD